MQSLAVPLLWAQLKIEMRAFPMQSAKMEPSGFFRRLSLLPHQLEARRTPAADMIVLCHLGVARLDRATWSLTIGGLVERPMRLDFAALTAYPKHTVTSFHQCAGSPLAPSEPTQRICNVRWGGARLADVLRECGPAPAARYVWSWGADYGAFGGKDHEAYLKDLPIERVPSDVLIAYELNDAPLPPEHGFPARLVVPGFYGTNSVKWLTRISLAQTRAVGPFTTRWYNDPDPDGEGKTIPVWSVAPQSVIVAPAPAATYSRGAPVEIWGWAWSDEGVARVDISTDGGITWSATELEPREERSWQQFRAQWRPSALGSCTLRSRAVSRDGTVQPDSRRRNAIYQVPITVD
jgi:DMSO/TMAO reductase YedYZ molybdopterin-dependent catalytic subunit